MDPAERIKKPLIHQVGSAVSLCRFYSHWLRTQSLSSKVAKKSSGKARFFCGNEQPQARPVRWPGNSCALVVSAVPMRKSRPCQMLQKALPALESDRSERRKVR